MVTTCAARRGRQQQGRGGVRDVDAAGQPLDRRPSESMPRPVERPHRHTGVAGLDCGAGRVQAILPAAREDRHSAARRCRGRQRNRRAMHVLADAGPRAQGGSIVEQHPHGTYASVRRSATRRPGLQQGVDGDDARWARSGPGGARREDCGRRHGLRRPGGRGVFCRERQRRHLRRFQRRQGQGAQARQDPDLRAGARGNRQAQHRREAPHLHHRAARGRQGLRHHLHRRRHPRSGGRLGRPQARARRRPRRRPRDGRLQGHRRQEHRAGRDLREGARGDAQGDPPPVQRRQQPGVPEAGRRGRRLPQARPRGHWRRRRARRRDDDASCTRRSRGPARRSW